jgi:hypothetical protein
MHTGRLKRIAAKVIMAVAVATFGLTGPSPVARADQERPINVFAISNQTPGMVSVYWDYYGDDHYGFVVEDPSAGLISPPLDVDKRGLSLMGLTPNTTYNFHVCAVYLWNRVCSSEDGGGYATVTTPAVQTPPPPPPPPNNNGGSSGEPKRMPDSPLPSNVRVTALTATSINVTWQTRPWPEGTRDHSLRVSCVDDWTNAPCPPPAGRPIPLTATSLQITGLDTGTRYRVSVCKMFDWSDLHSPAKYHETCSFPVVFEMQAPQAVQRDRCVETGTCVIPPAAETRRDGCEFTGSCGAPPPAQTRSTGCQLTGTCAAPPPTPTAQPTAAPAQPTAAPAQPTAAPAQPTAAPAQPPASTRSGRGCQLTGTC